MIGEAPGVLHAALTTIAACLPSAAALHGSLFFPATPWRRAALIGAALAPICPGATAGLAGAGPA